MNINVPKNDFEFEEGDMYAYYDTRSKILKIRGDESFYRKVIFRITKEEKGGVYCEYCGKKLNRRNSRIDHKNSKQRGGPSIPDNLAIVCENCNTKKSELNFEEYQESLKLSKEEKKAFKDTIQKKVKEIKVPDIPKQWFEEEKVSNIKFYKSSKRRYNKKFEKYLRENRYIIYPVILDRNNFVLEGIGIVLMAIEKNIEYIPVIRLNNVEKKI